MTSKIDNLAEIVLQQLPDDGTPVSNRIMRILLSRQIGYVVSTEDYFAARDVLFERGLIGRERGRGGQVFRIAAPPDNSEPPEFEEEVLEATLMAPLRAFLEKSFSPNLDLPPSPLSDIWIADTSQPQGRKGIWLNPDFILVSATRFRLVPDIQLDVHAFELKPTSKGSLLAVAQAVAQTRFAHFGHLVWHLPQGSRFENRLGEIESYCAHQGVGLILLRDPRAPEGAEVRVDPVRKPTPAAAIDAFLEKKLKSSDRDALARFLKVSPT